MKITLPGTPVDGHRIEYWSTEWGSVHKCHIEYHVNTPYRVFAGEDSHGAQIVNQWMHFRGERCEGRSDGWATPSTWKWEDSYETRDEAADALRTTLNHQIGSYERQIERIREQIADIDEAVRS